MQPYTILFKNGTQLTVNITAEMAGMMFSAFLAGTTKTFRDGTDWCIIVEQVAGIWKDSSEVSSFTPARMI